MSRSLVAVWVLVTVVSGGAVGIAGQRCWEARGRATAANSALAQLSQQSSELAELKASSPEWTRHGRPPAGLTPRISAALSASGLPASGLPASGLPASAMASVSPEAESPIGEADLKARRTRAALTLAPVTLPQLGGFLSAWRSREPQWTVSSIELAPQEGLQDGSRQNKGGAAVAAPGGDLPLRAVIGIETLFVDQGGGH